MSNRSKFKDPGLIIVVFLVIYSTIVFAWWPADIYVRDVSLVNWLMLAGLFIWFGLTIIYTIWVERIEKS